MAYGNAASAAFAQIREFAPLILGQDPINTEKIWEKLFRTTFWAQNGGPVVYAAISALDIALWDIKGKILNQPVYNLLGGANRTKIHSYASQLQLSWTWDAPNYISMSTPEDFAKSAELAVEDGFDTIKFDFFSRKPCDDPSYFTYEEKKSYLTKEQSKILESRLKAVRNAVGKNVDIIIESHSNMEAFGAIQFAEIMKKYDVLFYEEPNTPVAHLTKQVQAHTSVPIAGGERIYTRWQFIPFFESHALQVIQPDIGNCGGYTEVKKICDMAAAYEIGVQPHICASQLSTSIALHLEAVIPNFFIHEYHVSNLMKFNQGLTTVEPRPQNGYLALPEGPGLGNEISSFAFKHAAMHAIVN